MCNFFSFVTEPEGHGGKRFYFDWKYRSSNLQDDNHDSHSGICEYYQLGEDVCNKYEYNPLTKIFKVDQINSEIDDRLQAEDWVDKVDFKRIVEPLIIKPIINPFDLPKVDIVTDNQIELLKQWASVWDSVWDSVGASIGASIGASVRASVGASVWASVWDSVWASIGASIGASVWAYIYSFFDIRYNYDFVTCVNLWEDGLVPSYDGKTWKLHSGKNAEIVYEWQKNQI